MASSSLFTLSQQQRLYEQQQQQQGKDDHDMSGDAADHREGEGEGEDSSGMMEVDDKDKDPTGQNPTSSSSGSSSSQYPPVHVPDLLTHIRKVSENTQDSTDHSHQCLAYSDLPQTIDLFSVTSLTSR